MEALNRGYEPDETAPSNRRGSRPSCFSKGAPSRQDADKGGRRKDCARSWLGEDEGETEVVLTDGRGRECERIGSTKRYEEERREWRREEGLGP
ncbi:hypothetical protein O9K51_01806 [Purpureocillium lavendulum]|uniref:Uncharacterized protein n=1 Tax=Purpureocillium lavendulum TaxID=1247861 RepID=A0AB34G7Y6_9HYPO|nr:hypothetical protein O9K51_01806 [Purpureocillium lavendulum]